MFDDCHKLIKLARKLSLDHASRACSLPRQINDQDLSDDQQIEDRNENRKHALILRLSFAETKPRIKHPG